MSHIEQKPPKYFLLFFRWYCHPKLRDHIEGDLLEEYRVHVKILGRRTADRKFIAEVMLLFRPGIIRPVERYRNVNQLAMYKSYFKIGWRNMVKDKGYSIINIGGLALGIAVAMMIALWVHHELSFNKHNEHYERVAAVMQHNTIDGNIETWNSQSFQLGDELRNNYGSNFTRVVMSSFPVSSILSDEKTTISAEGSFMEAEAPELLSLKMLRGTRKALHDPTSILLSESASKSLFGNEDPVGKILKIDNGIDVKVTAVYQDLPDNSSFQNGLSFIAPLEILVKRGGTNLTWGGNFLQVFVQVADNVRMDEVSAAIKDIKIKNLDKREAGFKSQLFLLPMSQWHLHSTFKNGINTGGQIDLVWQLGSIGAFVLLLACINFMNLSTARAQKRAKEVGVRKVVGSARSQLVGQFFSESLLVVSLAFMFAILLVQLGLPSFNEISEKRIIIVWLDPLLWLVMISFIFLISIVAGSYPALYLSAFKPIKVLKGSFSRADNSALLRKVLVIVQFAVTVTLIIGTTIVYQQIQFVKNRPIGYDLSGLIAIPIKTKEVKNNSDALTTHLLAEGIASNVATSETTITNLWWSDTGYQWNNKDPNLQDNIYRGAVSYEFGRTVGWKIKEGRDFSRDFLSDSSAMILNEAAVRYMGFDHPIGETIKRYDRSYTVIGVVQDMLTQSVYGSNKQTVFLLDPFDQANFINVRISPQMPMSKAIEKISNAFVKINPATPFEYTFADDEFAEKVSSEERIGKLAAIFAVLAILISCLGLFGLASFVAEQRIKEIGVRKVLGASVFNVWKMLSNDFLGLVGVAILIASPVAYYLMAAWLLNYDYHMEMSWWTFVVAGLIAMLITLSTVSYQAIKAARANPVKSLRTE
ncbi:MAG: ABC transporter permease [Chryseolinea sp.]